MTSAGDPLHGIDDVPWDRLYHAYGPATDVPDQLRALTDTDPAERERAASQLWGNICHQGTRCQASQAAVPFLVALVDSPATPDRAEVLHLLARIAIGDRRDDALPFDPAIAFATAETVAGVDLSEVLERFYSDDDEIGDDEMPLMDAAAVLWEADCYHRTAAYQPVITRWISDPHDDVAARAAALVAWFPPTAESLSALTAIAVDRSRVLASANLTLGHTAHAEPRIDERLRQLMDSQTEPVAVTAAVALAHRHGQAIPPEALSILTDAYVRDLPHPITGWDRALRGFVAVALRRLGLS